MINQLEIELQYSFRIEYDPNSDLFKQTLKDYNEVIDKRATEKDMLNQIVWQVNKFGAERMIEGVGFIAVDGLPQGDPYSGINIKSGYDAVCIS